MASSGVKVKNFREMQRALAKADKETRLFVRAKEREVAEPVRAEAERLAASRIRNIGPSWSRMRVGITTRVVYVAPRSRGVGGRGRGPKRRPNLAGLLMDRAMQPALDLHGPDIEQGFSDALDKMAANFNRGGAL